MKVSLEVGESFKGVRRELGEERNDHETTSATLLGTGIALAENSAALSTAVGNLETKTKQVRYVTRALDSELEKVAELDSSIREASGIVTKLA